MVPGSPDSSVVRAASLALFLLVALSVATGCGSRRSADCPERELVKQGDVVSDMTVVGLDGRATPMKALIGGKVALIDVWATWCQPCKLAMPHLQALHNQFKDQGFVVVGVMTDANATKIGSGYMKDNPVSYPVVLDDDGASFDCAWGTVTGIPLMVLVDRDGKVLEVFQGTGDIGTLQRRITQIFTASAPAA
ncbi:MAG: TlpA family protein disulfide reductase [Acidobacteria bacterium]|nr:TlpA family protein disulfide reductase [Acidobacteriota bacterium]